MPNFEILGVSGVLAAVLFFFVCKLWTSNEAKDKRSAEQQAAYVKFLVDMTVTLAGLKQVIEQSVRRGEHDV